ncbi:MAG: hypothetical protein ABI995_06650 [Acidobacteriota bacterium]
MMRYFWSILVLTLPLLGQSTTTTYQTDVNGRRVASATTEKTAEGTTTSRLKATDGKQVPLDETSERVIRQDANGRLVEKTIKKYDLNGRLAGTDKVMVEETVLPGGGKTVKETISQQDLNGSFKEVERRVAETRVAGQTSTTNVTVDHASVNGGFSPSEKSLIVTTGAAGKQQTTAVVERLDANGRFRPVSREETSVTATGPTVVSNTAGYELDATGRLQLARQAAVTSTKRPDGGVSTETNRYSAESAGRPDVGAPKMRMQEQETVERKMAPDGSFTETRYLRSALPSDPNKLGAAQKVSETVCTGKCADGAAPLTSATSAAPATPASGKQDAAKGAAKQDAKGKNRP